MRRKNNKPAKIFPKSQQKTIDKSLTLAHSLPIFHAKLNSLNYEYSSNDDQHDYDHYHLRVVRVSIAKTNQEKPATSGFFCRKIYNITLLSLRRNYASS